MSEDGRAKALAALRAGSPLSLPHPRSPVDAVISSPLAAPRTLSPLAQQQAQPQSQPQSSQKPIAPLKRGRGRPPKAKPDKPIPTFVAPTQKPLDVQVQQPQNVTGGTLRGYQVEALNWLIQLYENGLLLFLLFGIIN